jgi:hypothetical protein
MLGVWNLFGISTSQMGHANLENLWLPAGTSGIGRIIPGTLDMRFLISRSSLATSGLIPVCCTAKELVS